MEERPVYYLVEQSVLPEIFLKVMEAKKLLYQGKVKTIHEAVQKCEISRSAFYKYKDGVELFSDVVQDKIVTLHVVVKDEQGVLSMILSVLAKAGANILTINQNIPVNGTADITVSLRTGQLKLKFERLLEKLKGIDGVLKVNVLSSEK